MMTTMQDLCTEVMEGIQAVTSGRIRSLAVDAQGETFVLKGYCDAFYLRKGAIDAAKLKIDEAVDKGRIPVASLTDRIEVRHQGDA